MKKSSSLAAALLALCLLLCACVQTPPVVDDPPINSGGQQTDAPPTSDSGSTGDDDPVEAPQPLVLEELTVELVLDWQQADALLSRLGELEDTLAAALDKGSCTVEHLTLTISTAGGFTAQALRQGGIGAAVLPALDFITCEKDALAVAMSGEELCESIVAVSSALGEDVAGAFFKALTTTEEGAEFLAACRPGAAFGPITEDGLQAVRDYLAQLEEEHEHQIP